MGEWTWAAKVRDCGIVAEDLETEARLGDVKRMHQESLSTDKGASWTSRIFNNSGLALCSHSSAN